MKSSSSRDNLKVLEGRSKSSQIEKVVDTKQVTGSQFADAPQSDRLFLGKSDKNETPIM